MSYKAKILSTDQDIVINEGETILSAALRQDIEFPHSCKSGRCGACKSRLKTGEVEHLNHLRFTLTEQEKTDGIILACRAVPKTDVEVAWLNNEEHPKFLAEAMIIEKSMLTSDTTRLVIQVPEAIRVAFQPGQYALLRIPGLPERSYSMANRSNGPLLEFFVRQVPGGRVSNFIAQDLIPGTLLQMEGPFGTSYLRQDHTGPILAVAGGSGLAPIKSIVDTALHIGMKQEIHLYFGVREQQDFYLLDHFGKIAQEFPHLHFHTVMDRGGPRSQHRVARLDHAIFSDWKSFEGSWQAYIAGPPPMVESLALRLPEKGIPPDSIFADPFTPSRRNA